MVQEELGKQLGMPEVKHEALTVCFQSAGLLLDQ
jgi:hypothetical protein